MSPPRSPKCVQAVPKYSTFSVRLGQTTACIVISLSFIADYTYQDQRQIDTCLGDQYLFIQSHLLKPYTKGCPSPSHKSTCIYTCVAIPTYALLVLEPFRRVNITCQGCDQWIMNWGACYPFRSFHTLTKGILLRVGWTSKEKVEEEHGLYVPMESETWSLRASSRKNQGPGSGKGGKLGVHVFLRYMHVHSVGTLSLRPGLLYARSGMWKDRSVGSGSSCDWRRLFCFGNEWMNE